MSQVVLYNPVGEIDAAGRDAGQAGERLGLLANKVIGFIDDMKPNAGQFLKIIEELMKADHPIPATHTVRKKLTPNMAIAHDLDSSVQGAVVAWGD
ncbi:MAG: hypothetical protein O7G32_11825 [SAR324 cluster bacterium]|nr:hypothetical protein [SAR324 cluster bacterium]